MIELTSRTPSIQKDMIMLQNQLPLFILDRLLGLQFDEPDQKGLASKLALGFFDQCQQTLTKSEKHKLDSSLRYATTFDPSAD